MLRYILVLLLTNASYRSLGNPIQNPTGPGTLVNSMTALAADCENAFLSSQIKANILPCSTLPSPHGEKQLQCLVFYDINKQLCTAVNTGKIALSEEDYTPKITEEQDVNSLCDVAKDWVFSNLTEFSRYKQGVDKVFKHPVTCGKLCAVEDFLSDDANFFCKYYKWGTDVLKQVISTSTQNTVNNAQPQDTANVNKDESVSNDLQDVQIKETSSTNPKLNTPTSNSVVSETQPKVDLVKPETTSLAVNQKSQSVDPGTISNVAAVPDIQSNKASNVDNVEDTGVLPGNTLGDQTQTSKSGEDVAKSQTVPDSGTKVKAEDTQNKPDGVEKTEETKEIQQLNNELENKPPVLETPNGKSQVGDDDYPDSEEGKEGLSDMQGGDDGDDPILGDVPVEEQKPAQKAETASTFNREPYYTSPVASYPEDDDHFFSFFLTAIVLIVLIYVLYHNKNKVGKVFFGLVVEGRQGGRRRGSRGPAYRRLDTLEQAISASAAAPPTKIIY